MSHSITLDQNSGGLFADAWFRFARDSRLPSSPSVLLIRAYTFGTTFSLAQTTLEDKQDANQRHGRTSEHRIHVGRAPVWQPGTCVFTFNLLMLVLTFYIRWFFNAPSSSCDNQRFVHIGVLQNTLGVRSSAWNLIGQRHWEMGG